MDNRRTSPTCNNLAVTPRDVIPYAKRQDYDEFAKLTYYSAVGGTLLNQAGISEKGRRKRQFAPPPRFLPLSRE